MIKLTFEKRKIKGRQINIRLTEQEFQEIKKIAAKNKISVSGAYRALIAAALKELI